MPEQAPDRLPARLWAEHGFALSPRIVVFVVLGVVLLGQLTARLAVALQAP